MPHATFVTGHIAGLQGADVNLLLAPAQTSLPKRLLSNNTTEQRPQWTASTMSPAVYQDVLLTASPLQSLLACSRCPFKRAAHQG